MNAYIGENVKFAREYYGLTQSALAKNIGISQPHLSKMEKGEKEIDQNIINFFSNDFNESFFKNELYETNYKLFYRKLASISKNKISSFESRFRIIADTVSKLLDVIEIPAFDLPKIDPQDHLNNIEHIANIIRFELGLNGDPIEDIVKLLEKRGVIIHFMDYENLNLDNNRFDGVSSYVDGVPVILINKKIPDSRKVFTIAHELGHIIMHFDFIIDPTRDIEKEANEFASELLLPTIEMQKVLKTNRLTVEHIFNLKSEWKVSAAAILHKAKSINNFSELYYRQWMIRFAPYKKIEPFEFELSEPTLLKRMINLVNDTTESNFLKQNGLTQNSINEIFYFFRVNNSIKKLRISF